MVGHKLTQVLSNNYKVFGTSRKNCKSLKNFFPNASKFFQIDFLSDNFISDINSIKPDVIINCIGITTRRISIQNQNLIEFINSKLPKVLSKYCDNNDIKFIHFSTDCVFSGKRGNYNEQDRPDASDIYGLSKSKAEKLNPNSLIIRSSMIGREIYNKTEFLEWIISSKNTEISGYNQSFYSGVSTIWMSNTIEIILKNFNSLRGLYNVSSVPITKFKLANLINNKFNLNITIKESNQINSNKVLISSKFVNETGILKPSWEDLIDELYEDSLKFKSIY